MKILRFSAMLIAVMLLFTLVAFAAEFVPSIEYKDGPTVVKPDETTDPGTPDDELLVTPPSAGEDAHDDIRDNLEDAMEALEEAIQDLVDNFDKIWEDITGDAPTENAIITDVFDVRYESELGKDDDGVTLSFDVTVQGIEPDDIFLIITKPYGENAWRIVNYTINEDGVITIEGTTKAAYAIIKDKAALPPVGPDGPATGVPEYLLPAVAGVVVFGTAAIFCIRKITKREEA